MSDAIVRHEPKSWAQKFVDLAKGEIIKAPHATPATFAREAGSVAFEYVEGAITGGLLGTYHAQYGLDSKVGAVDGWLAGIGAILGVALAAHSPFWSARARGVGSKALTVLAFRRSFELVGHQPMPGGTAPGVKRIAAPGTGPGVTTQDRIEAVAKDLG